MITRIWHGLTNPRNAEQYRQVLLTTGTQEYLETPGNLSVKIWEKQDTDCTHFWTVTEWRDVPSIIEFAGNDYQKPKYYPEDKDILLEFEKTVDHYTCYEASNAKIKDYQQQFIQLNTGGNWLNENYKAKLANVQAQEAFRSPLPGVHSIAEIVWHVVYWRTCCLKFIDGDNHYKEQTVDTLNFLPLDTLRNKGWDTLVSELWQTQDALMERLASKRDYFLAREYQPGYTFDYLLEGQLHHDAYHLGQIGLVQKILSLQGGAS